MSDPNATSEACRTPAECIDPAGCLNASCAREMFGGEAQPIVMTPEDRAELERLMEYVDRKEHLPP